MLSTLNMYPIKNILFHINIVILGSWSENILDYFLRNNQIRTEDGAEIIWYHAANHKSQMHEALKSKWLLLFLSEIIFLFLFILFLKQSLICSPGWSHTCDPPVLSNARVLDMSCYTWLFQFTLGNSWTQYIFLFWNPSKMSWAGVGASLPESVDKRSV